MGRRLLLTLGIAIAVWNGPTAAAEQTAQTRVRLQIGGSEIAADVFEPARSAGEAPVVVVLHGAGGMWFDGPEMRRVAGHLAAEGNAVYLLHYFNRTGTIVAFDSTMERHFGTWRQTVADAIITIQKARGTHTPVGIYGYSLGAFLAIYVASDNRNVAAVVEQAGGVWKGKEDRVRRMPPVLMVHGIEDRRVPFAKYAEPLLPLLKKRSARVETLFFTDEGHGFSQPAMRKVREAAARFFGQHLTPAPRLQN